MATYPRPRDKAGLRTFLGLAGYYCHFIPDYARLTAPLTDLTAKAAEWEWESQHEEAMDRIRTLLTERPVLCHPDFTKPFIVQTDYSSAAIGAVLSQRDEQGHDHPIAYLSRKCRGAEKSYSARRGEAVAIRHALKKWRCFLEGQQFVIETDHRTLEFQRKEADDAQLSRIWEARAPFD